MIMTCDEIQESLSLYADDGLPAAGRAVCYEHLEVCPVCRAHLEELRAIRGGLAMLSRPSPPVDLITSINQGLTAQASAQRARRSRTVGDIVSEWLEFRVPRYAFSSFASILIFASVLGALRPHMIALNQAARAIDEAAITKEPVDPLSAAFEAYDINKPISPESYAALRTPYNAESPSLNPGGALAMLSWSPIHDNDSRQDADDMIVVADVFTNGAASLADVMHAPRDRRMLADFEKALRKDAAFVPAALDRRPETMRVVFSVQRVNVREPNY